MKSFFTLTLVFTLFSLLAKKVKVGLCIDNITTDRWAVEIKSIENGIRSKGGSVFVKTALGSASHQEEQVTELISTQKINVLILVPVDKVKAAKIVTDAQKKGVKVILYSRNVEGAKADAFISFDPYQIGVSQANYVKSLYPNSNVTLLGGPMKDLNSEQIKKGQLSIFDSSEIKIISSTHTKSWSKKKAYDKIKSLDESLSNKIDIVIAGNDLLATGVIEYYGSVNKKVKVIGVDAELRACQRIANDTQEMSIFLDIKKSAYCAAIVAMELGTNHNADISTKGIIHKKENGVDVYLIDSIVISKENLEQITQELHLYTHQQIFGK